ncbi:MAG: hypothetical protein AAB520_00290 [Patescibacteria group bacterium]
MEENQAQATVQTASKNKVKIPLIILLFLITLVLSTSVAYLLGSRTNTPNQSTANPQQIENKSQNAASPTPSLDNSSTDWKRTNNLGPFSFEYPYGWHIASRWPEDSNQSVAVWMDTEPISGAPRGGPFAKIEMSWRNGIPNAEEVFNKTKEDFKKNTNNVKEEIIKSDIGDIYHYTGILPEGFLGGAAVDEYVMMINISDNINDVVITVSTIDKPDLKDTLRRIALSIKRN